MRLDSLFGWTVLLLLVSAAAAEKSKETERGDVLVVDGSVLSDLVTKHSKVVLLFTDEKCLYCQEFDETYTMLSRVHSHDISYLKIEYN
jgi:thioredoxin-related protein